VWFASVAAAGSALLLHDGHARGLHVATRCRSAL